MFKFLRERKKDNKGFTLVELVIVIAILAILVGLLAPQYTKYVEKARKSADVDNMEEMVKAVQVYAVDNAIGTSNSAAQSTIAITLKASGVELSDNTTKDGEAALKEYVPNYTKIARKSKKWAEDPKATITIDTDGKVTVKYEPDDFASYSDGKTTATPTPQGSTDAESGEG